ncbi:Alpha/beta hydrolase fold-1 [Coniochaeta sp. 2T2.1]|nr:Alpha/beta hydrolase fold-1 [Coniochaeta sp. 2T2.1]
MSKDNVEIVIVPGFFATTPPYQVLVDGLKAKGFNARTVGLPSVNDGTRFPAATMQDDAAEIRSAVLSILDDPQTPRNVVLAAHSYGGVPTTEALKGLSKADRSAEAKSTAAVGLLYMAAFIPQMGQSVQDLISTDVDLPEAFRHPAPGTYYPTTPAEFASFVFNDVEDPAEAARLHATFERHSADSYDGKVSYAAWKDIPSVQIVPSVDMVISVAKQQEMADRVKELAPGKFKQAVYEGAGHCFCWHGAGIGRTVDELVKLAEENL